MCNYSYAIAEQTAEKKDLTSIQNLMQTTGWSVTEAMEKLKIDPEKRSDYADIINGIKPVMA